MRTAHLQYQKVTVVSLALVGSLCAQIGPALPCWAAKSPTASGASAPALDPFKELSLLEKRLFSRAYQHDPPEKRLERLECLVFGASSQSGSNDERFKRLKEAIAKNDQEAAKAVREQGRKVISEKKAATSQPSGNKRESSSVQYPILNTLEWRALQKTYGKESLDQRLDRLETQLFGQPSTAMSYVDRIERLKKIIGIAALDESNESSSLKKMVPQGPLPRAYGRRSVSPFRTTPFGTQSTPYVTPLPGGGGETFEDDYRARLDADLPTIMNHLNKHMDDMMKMMMEDARTPGGSSPYAAPLPSSPYAIPMPSTPSKKEKPKVPPYADPNSI